MIVGNSSLSVEDVVNHSGSYEELVQFSDSQIPDEWKHIQAIVDNQRYVCALLLRRSSVKWEHKKGIIDRIMSEVTILGYPNVLYDTKAIWGEISRDGVKKYYERSLVGDVKPSRSRRKLS